MKRFYYQITKSTRRYYGGRNETAVVYKNTREGLKEVATVNWCTAAYKGEESEVFEALIKAKEIPAKYWESSACGWASAGYFAGEVTEKYQIVRL